MNPEKITDAPLIVLSDLTSGLVEFIIKKRTKGDYNHVMWLNRQGYFASQGNTYSEAPISRYTKKNSRLKFYEVSGLTPVQKRLIQESIERKLKLPWWKKMYDWLGIAGQAVGVKGMNIPWFEYCSEDVPHHLKYMASKGIPNESEIYKIIMGIPSHASPQDLNEYFKKHPDVFRVYGKWEADDERASVAVGQDDARPVTS